MTISQRIFFELKKQNKTQKQLSEFTGISTSTISAWNKNGTNPSADSIYPISKFLNVSLEYLLTGNEANVSNNITTGNIQGNHNANINIGSSQKAEDAQEILAMIQELSLIQRSEIVLAINKMKSEK